MSAVLTLFLLTQAQDPVLEGMRELGWGVEPRAAVWWPGLSGEFQADQGNGVGPAIDGTTIRLDNDLEIDDGGAFGYYEIGVTQVVGAGERRATIDRMTVSFWANSWEGDATLGGPEVFNGVTFGAGERVESQFRVWSFGLDGAVPMAVDFGSGTFVSTFTFGLRVVDVRLEMSAPGRETDEQTRLLYLGVGMRNEWKPSDRFFLAGTFGVYASVGSVDDMWGRGFEEWGAVAAEGAASVGVDVARVRIEAGYRFASNAFSVRHEHVDLFEENDASYFIGGPFAQVSVRW